MLLKSYQNVLIEAGCDEAGRGCLAGPVFAAAVIFSEKTEHDLINDSKKLNAKSREYLKCWIEDNALDFAIASVDAGEIDKINIHNASYLAMHKALDQLKTQPEHLIIDGNRFIPYRDVKHTCIIKGDSKYISIAAASILAKTSRDEFMLHMHDQFPIYGWNENKGYPTVKHRNAILQYGTTPIHRMSFKITDPQLKLF